MTQGHPIGAPKTGGRTAGTLNKRSWEARLVAAGRDFDPLEELITLYRDPDTPLPDRIKALSYALPYLYPRLSSAAVTISSGEDSWTECMKEINARYAEGQARHTEGNGSGGSNGAAGGDGSGH